MIPAPDAHVEVDCEVGLSVFGGELERAALGQTILFISSERFPKLLQSLDSHATDRWTRTFQDVVVQSLSIFWAVIKQVEIAQDYALHARIGPCIPRWLSTRHHRLLLHLLQRGWSQGIEVSPNDSNVLMIFHELDEAVASTPQPFAKLLLEICAKQQVSYDCWPRETLPVCMLLDVVLRRKYTLDGDGTSRTRVHEYGCTN